MFRLPYYDIVITVSEARFYANAARKLKITAKETCEFIDDGTGMLLDLNISSRITGEIIDFDIPVPTKTYRQHAGWVQTIA